MNIYCGCWESKHQNFDFKMTDKSPHEDKPPHEELDFNETDTKDDDLNDPSPPSLKKP